MRPEHRNRKRAERRHQRLEPTSRAFAIRRARWRCRHWAASRAAARRSRSGWCTSATVHPVCVADARRDRPAQPRRASRDLGLRAREVAHRRQRLGQPIGIAVELAASPRAPPAGSCRGAARASSGSWPRAATRSLATDDEAGLRAAQQLVAGEGDEVGALGQRLLARRRLVRQAPARQIDQGAAAQILDERQPCARAPAPPAPAPTPTW